MTRRSFLSAAAKLAAAGVALLAFPLSRAADPTENVVRVGFVSPYSLSTSIRGVTVFWERLRELGWVEAQNLVIETRWAEGQYDRLPVLMADVIGRKVDVLVTHSTPAAIAAKNATGTIPIVVATMGDPIRSGLAASLARPGGNLTGMSLGWGEGMAGKWLELLQETVPRLSHVAVITSTDNPIAGELAKELEAIAPTRGLKLRLIEVRDSGALDHAFEQARRKAQAVLVLPGHVEKRRQIAALAAKHRLPAIYTLRDYVDAGGLMAYGPDLAVMFRRAADYVDKILRGARPADLPIEQPTQYVFVVNLKLPKPLGSPSPNRSCCVRMR